MVKVEIADLTVARGDGARAGGKCAAGTKRRSSGNGQAEARSMMSNLIAFTDLKISDVMVPRADITAIDANASARELLNRFTDANHSRLPVFRETLDDPSGMVHIKDFMRWMTEKSFARRAAAGVPRTPEEAASQGMVCGPRILL